MKSAILYIRVSTDEQADTGFSQRHQEEMLRRYCQLQDIHISQVYLEDHSAKNFKRPEFTKMLLYIRKQKGIIDQILFTKWDRFSRSGPDAYAMISTLNKLGVEPLAIEQPLDLSVPENKIMLAFYLTAPEVENDRRALNVKTGMRRALKEGRFMGKAPVGYINRQMDKKKWIEPHPEKAQHVIYCFEEVASGKYSTESVLKSARSRGFICSKNNFWRMLNNPVYMGQILLPPYKGDPATLQPGQHTPIISADLYYQVQDVLQGKKKQQKTKKTVDDRFPLRGFIICHADGRLLTASSSKGRKQYYDYYHCTSECGTRHPAANIHNAIIQELAKWTPDPAVKELYKLILEDINGQTRREQLQQLKELQLQLKNLAEKMNTARELLLNKQLDPDDYKIIKNQVEEQRARAESKVSTITEQQQDITPLIDAGLSSLENIAGHYQNASTETKRLIIDSIFPDKLEFDGSGFRTARVNEAVSLLFNLGAAFSQIKTGQEHDFAALSREVIPPVHFSNRFIHDLRKLARLADALKAA